ncbi:hypothetical protein CAPTEDRAFT_218851 [Capitella teleta]|uniref:Aminotransferase class I/classII large domain-containing protein n=1 Tax=Capitella teleta TaxID=283909 RepID=R7TBC4_CAPTE|nr:hypothetical protein CAPTEDRAFT_218851 [Capitella teleta]|eukprot:ELT88309.1 hypothetical protein CAPTEDRAFT_218851 [Capitella teleta]
MPRGVTRVPLPLESYQNENKPKAKYLLSCSDANPMTSAEVLAMADPELKALWDDLDLSYGDPWGSEILRREVAKMHEVQVDQVLIHVPQGAIYIGLNVIVPYLSQKYDEKCIHIISCNPAYTVLNENPKHLDCDMDFWNGEFTDEGWKFDLNDMKSMVINRTRLVIINFPQNPTGFCLSRDDYFDLIDFCRQHDIFIFSDEMYMFTNQRDWSPELPSVCTLYRESITLFGMSKTFGQPGLGIGWLISQNKGLLRRMMDYKDYLTNGSPRPSEVIATISLRNREKILKANLKIINKNLDILDVFFDEFKDIFEWHRPHGGTMTLVKVKGWAAELGEKKGASGFCQFAMDEGQIMLVPSHIFGIEDSFFRIGFGRKDLKDCVKALKAVLLKGKPQPLPPVQEEEST